MASDTRSIFRRTSPPTAACTPNSLCSYAVHCFPRYLRPRCASEKHCGAALHSKPGPSSLSALVLAPLLIIRRELILNEPNQRDAHFRRVIASQHIADEVNFYLHLDLELSLAMA